LEDVLKRLRRAGVVAAVLLLLALALSLSYRAYVRHAIAEARAIRSPEGIDSLEAVRIGGLDQWIHVRGEHTKNPVLLFIHGGPGAAFIGLARTFQSPWEKHFTIVQWDQRGAGKTYTRNDRELQRRTMTVRQFQQDTLDMANYLRRRFDRDKIVVLGASWGSVLGLWLAHEHPEVVAAYVGVGQAVDLRLNGKTAYEDALAVARTRGLHDAVRELEALRPYPDPGNLRKGSVAQTWQARLLGPPDDRSRFLDIPRLLSTVLTAPEYSLYDVYGFTRGQIFSIELMIPEVSTLNLTTLGSDFRVPVFFFQGRSDPYTRPALIEAYARTVTAPRYEMVWFERAGHFPFFEEPQKFIDELVSRVLPIVLKPEAWSLLDQGSSKTQSDDPRSGGAVSSGTSGA
jgi:proline iminopeptidase